MMAGPDFIVGAIRFVVCQVWEGGVARHVFPVADQAQADWIRC
jgi:hypothetical protein